MILASPFRRAHETRSGGEGRISGVPGDSGARCLAGGHRGAVAGEVALGPHGRTDSVSRLRQRSRASRTAPSVRPPASDPATSAPSRTIQTALRRGTSFIAIVRKPTGPTITISVSTLERLSGLSRDLTREVERINTPGLEGMAKAIGRAIDAILR